MSWPDEPYWSGDNAISNEEDDRITAEEAAKTPEQINAEAIALLAQTVLGLSQRVKALEAQGRKPRRPFTSGEIND